MALGVTALRDKDIVEANKIYKDQYHQVNAYVERYQVLKFDQLKWDEVAKKDRVAGGLMKNIKAEVHKSIIRLPIPLFIFSFCSVFEIPFF